MERSARDKHSSLLRKFVNYGRKKFYNIGPSATSSNDVTNGEKNFFCRDDEIWEVAEVLQNLTKRVQLCIRPENRQNFVNDGGIYNKVKKRTSVRCTKIR